MKSWMKLTIALAAIVLAGCDNVPDCAFGETCMTKIQPLATDVTDQEPNEVLRRDRSGLPDYYQIHQVVSPYFYPAGTLIVDTPNKTLYLMEEKGLARRYPIAVGREGYSFAGQGKIGRKTKWPSWRPTPDMIEKDPTLDEVVEGGPKNPLGSRALYIYAEGRDTLYRIHGTNSPRSIGSSSSSGCIRMFNEDVIDLYNRVPKGAPVVVIGKANLAEGEEVDIIRDGEEMQEIDDPVYDIIFGRSDNPLSDLFSSQRDEAEITPES